MSDLFNQQVVYYQCDQIWRNFTIVVKKLEDIAIS